VIAAARGQWRVLFILAALTGARLSELCGLTCADVRLDDLDDAAVEFAWQVDRKGKRRPTKTDGSARTVPIPRELAVILAKHKLAIRNSRPDAYVFATATGRARSQRNVGRALRATQRRAVDEHGAPTLRSSTKRTTRGIPSRFPVVRFPRCTASATPSPAGRSSRVRAWTRLLSCSGHSNANVTRTVYLREISDGRRRARRRSQMVGEYGAALDAAAGPIAPTARPDAKVHRLREAS
jgi:integrase